ncbi:hypothetical protein ACFSHQ_12350 [Gemmobacter lanyuensis]
MQRVVKFAMDVSDQKRRASEDAGRLAALSRSMATIEFDVNGTILDANENFLSLMEYDLDQVRGSITASSWTLPPPPAPITRPSGKGWAVAKAIAANTSA